MQERNWSTSASSDSTADLDRTSTSGENELGSSLGRDLRRYRLHFRIPGNTREPGVIYIWENEAASKICLVNHFAALFNTSHTDFLTTGFPGVNLDTLSDWSKYNSGFDQLCVWLYSDYHDLLRNLKAVRSNSMLTSFSNSIYCGFRNDPDTRHFINRNQLSF